MVRNAYLEHPALVGVCLGVVRGMDFDDAESVRLRLKKPARALRLDKTGAWRPVGQGKVITLDRIEAFTCAPVKLVWE